MDERFNYKTGIRKQLCAMGCKLFEIGVLH